MKPQFDADQLAKQLDEMFSSDQISAESHPLVSTAKRLYDAPSPELSPEAFMRIRNTVLQTAGLPTSHWIHPGFIGIGMVVLIGVILIVMLNLSNSNGEGDNTISLTEDSILVEIETQQVDMDSPTPVTESVGATETITQPPTEPAVTVTATPTDMPSPTRGTGSLYLEGPIDTIADEVIEIYGIAIQIDSDMSFDHFSIGDIVRVEAQLDQTSPLPIFIASSIELVQISQPSGDSVNENVQNTDTSSGTGNVDNSAVTGDESSLTNPDQNGDETECQNPPPDHAPAPGWRARCEDGGAPQDTNPGRGN